MVCKEVNANIDINNIVINKTSSSRITLVGALQNSALNGGDKITSNGYNGNSKYIIQYIRCQCSQKYQVGEKKVGTYRQDTYVNNRRNNRCGAAGKHGIKRTDTSLSRKKDNLCNFYISLYQDTRGFYVKSKSCHVFHKNHAKRDHIRVSSRNVTGSDRKEIRIGGSACAASSVGMNMHYQRTKDRNNTASILSRRQIRYICDDIFPSSKDKCGMKNSMGEIDNLYEYLKEVEYPHVSLLQKVVNTTSSCISNSESLLFTESNINGTIKNDMLSACHKDEEAIQFSNDHRKARNISNDQEMMVAIACSSPFQI